MGKFDEDDITGVSGIIAGCVLLGWFVTLFVAMGLGNEPNFYVLEEREGYKYTPTLNSDGYATVDDPCFSAPRLVVILDFFLLFLGELGGLAIGCVAGILTCICIPCIYCVKGGDVEDDDMGMVLAGWAVLITVGGFLALGIYPISLADQCLSNPPGSYPYPSGFALGIFHVLFLLPVVCGICMACCGGCLEMIGDASFSSNRGREAWDSYDFESNYRNREMTAISMDSVSSNTLVVTPSGTYGNTTTNVDINGDQPKKGPVDNLKTDVPTLTKTNSLPVFDPETGMFTTDEDFKPPPTADADYGAPPPTTDYTSPPMAEPEYTQPPMAEPVRRSSLDHKSML